MEMEASETPQRVLEAVAGGETVLIKRGEEA
jgi:hypothetical protein